jgi:hypothetical protein
MTTILITSYAFRFVSFLHPALLIFLTKATFASWNFRVKSNFFRVNSSPIYIARQTTSFFGFQKSFFPFNDVYNCSAIKVLLVPFCGKIQWLVEATTVTTKLIFIDNSIQCEYSPVVPEGDCLYPLHRYSYHCLFHIHRSKKTTNKQLLLLKYLGLLNW